MRTHTNFTCTLRISTRLACVGLELLALAALATPAAAQFRLQVRRRAPVDLPTGLEVLTRGPVHEAFAEPVTLDPVPGLMSRIPPPEPIDEQPPDEAPQFIHGTAEWIPGYWAYDDPDNEYLWVSGIWRVPPPGATWVPGYWSATGDGFRWTPGFWLTDEDNEIEYYWDPPANLDDGPPGDPPRADLIWVPGAWYSEQSYEWSAPPGAEVDRRDGFFWRPGYWLRARPEWTWVPAHYIWTGRGNIFVDGHWDHALERRGLLFAPVRFEPTALSDREFRYVPRYVIDTRILVTHLFTRPRYAHYYFGDYYAPRYVRRGIVPWYDLEHIGYDPLFVSHRWRHRDDPDWLPTLRREYVRRQTDVALRPPITLRAQVERVRTVSTPDRDLFALAQPLRALTSAAGSDLRLQALDDDRRRVVLRQGRALRELLSERTRWERQDLRSDGQRQVLRGDGQSPPLRADDERQLVRPDGTQAAQPQPAPGAAGARGVPRGEPARVRLPQAPVTGRQSGVERPPEPEEPQAQPGESKPRKIRRTPR